MRRLTKERNRGSNRKILVSAQVGTDARRNAHSLVANGDGTVRCVLLYGARLWGISPDPHSAFDYFVVVDEYGRFYGALRKAGRLHRPAWLLTALAAVLPPNSIAYHDSHGPHAVAKCLVISLRDFEQGLGPTARDHFIIGRLIQRTEIVWAASEQDHEWISSRLAAARARVLDWMAPFLDAPVDARSLGQQILEVCYRAELRPEPLARAATLVEAQSEHFVQWLTPLLEAAAVRGAVHRMNGQFCLSHRVGWTAALRWRLYFAMSKVRSTARWAKYVVTFEGWLAYLVRKVERHTGKSIELRWLERRWPLIFLWPRAIAVLRRRTSQREEGSP